MKEFFSSTTGKIITAAVGILLVIAIILLATSGAGASSTTRGIGLEQSINAALADAGLSRDQVSGLQGHFDKDDGPDAYEVSFYANSCEYEYTIKASDGDILECKIESPEGQRVTAQQARDLEKDSKPAKSASNASSDYIGIDKAKSIALQNAGIDRLRLDLRLYPESTARRIAELYVYATADSWNITEAAEKMDLIVSEFTKGHLYRGV